jgi:hypothetical protein
MRRPADLSVDQIDWAAVRALAPLMLQLYDDEFHATTGHDLEELRELGQQAINMRREYRTPRHAVSYAIGDCEVVLPTAFFEDRSYVVAVPEHSSWNAVVPDCARNRRDEFVVPLRSRLPKDCVWIELSVGSMEELEAWLDARRRKKPKPNTSVQPRFEPDARDGSSRGGA